MLAVTGAAVAVAAAVMTVVMGMTFPVEVIVVMGMRMAVSMLMAMLMRMGNAVMGMLVGMAMGMAVVVIAAGNMVMMNMHKNRSFRVFLYYIRFGAGCQQTASRASRIAPMEYNEPKHSTTP